MVNSICRTRFDVQIQQTLHFVFIVWFGYSVVYFIYVVINWKRAKFLFFFSVYHFVTITHFKRKQNNRSFLLCCCIVWCEWKNYYVKKNGTLNSVRNAQSWSHTQAHTRAAIWSFNEILRLSQNRLICQNENWP